MGKPIGKKKPQQGDAHSKITKHQLSNPKAFDEDTAVFITMSQELKEEGNKLFQRKDHEGAMLKFEKALKLLPRTHIDVASLRTSMASCYVQMGIGEYPRAINECNLALMVAPKYSKALLRRARCYEALNRLDLAWKDVCLVLGMEPNNISALEIRDSVRREMEGKGIKVEEMKNGVDSKSPDSKSKGRKKKEVRIEEAVKVAEIEKSEKETRIEEIKENRMEMSEKGSMEEEGKEVIEAETKKSEKETRIEEIKENGVEMSERIEEIEKGSMEEGDKWKSEDKEVVEEKISIKEETMVTRRVKLVFGDDIRWAEVPISCSLLLMRDIVRDRFPNLGGVLIKYRDQEGDFVTITTTDELRKAEASGGSEGSLRLYIYEVSPDQEPAYLGVNGDKECYKGEKKSLDGEVKELKVEDKEQKGSTCVDTWILQFAQLFKNHVGFDSDAYLDLHEVGMKLYSEAIEEVVSAEEAQGLFDIASEKFQEMAALALFNWGNVHMSKARKQVYTKENSSNESTLAQIKAAYEWSMKEYAKAGKRYDESLKMKPDFYEGYLALGLQQFEQAKLSWANAVRNNNESEESSSNEVLQLFNKAEDSMEAGIQIWEEMEERRLNGISEEEVYKSRLQKLGLDGLIKDISADAALEQAKIMRAQIHIVWGSLLYERSVIEFKLGLPTWEECLEVAVEKFELAGASKTDIAVMVKQHCAHQTAQQGLGFKIDEIVQAWHEMYDARRWLLGVPSFRLEPLFRRRVPRLQSILEQHV